MDVIRKKTKDIYEENFNTKITKTSCNFHSLRSETAEIRPCFYTLPVLTAVLLRHHITPVFTFTRTVVR